ILFRDPDFDAEPLSIYEPGPDDPPVPPEQVSYTDAEEFREPPQSGEENKIYVSGVSARIIAERIEYLGPDGKLLTESYREFSCQQIHSEFKSLDDFLRRWNQAEKKQIILKLLKEQGVLLEHLAAEVGPEYGEFDLICHIAFDQPPLTRHERVAGVKKRNYFSKYGSQARTVLTHLLDTYANAGIAAIEDNKILKLKPFSELGTPLEIIKQGFGGKAAYQQALVELEEQLYLEKTA
ncbi:MAG: restriction endonuclease, partial [Candidatus Electrothrix sp. AR3]|nr:restriction endonuclease [Candidatus Electrothrix sp. AR3]